MIYTKCDNYDILSFDHTLTCVLRGFFFSFFFPFLLKRLIVFIQHNSKLLHFLIIKIPSSVMSVYMKNLFHLQTHNTYHTLSIFVVENYNSFKICWMKMINLFQKRKSLWACVWACAQRLVLLNYHIKSISR